jgi:Mce-associated membrane protein
MTETEETSTAPAAHSSWLVPGILVALVVALLATSTVIWVKRGDSVDDGMLVAARQEATAFFNLDYRHAEKDVAKVLALATGTFKKEYGANSDAVVSQVQEKKLVAVASIPKDGVAVEFADEDRGQVLVVVDVERTIGTTTDSLRNRARIILKRVDGRWLVSGVNQVG